jgi:predicted permease
MSNRPILDFGFWILDWGTVGIGRIYPLMGQMIGQVQQLNWGQLGRLYLPLVGWAFLGWVLGKWLPNKTPTYLGRFLFWIGVPISIFAFLRGAVVSWQLWIAPAIAWVAILSSAGLAWLWLRKRRSWTSPTKGSFLLASMFGNTGYLGYPIALALLGSEHFAWILIYDMVGTTFGAYGLGVVLASRFGNLTQRSPFPQDLIQNPALWSCAIGFIARDLPLPNTVETGLHQFSWGVISLSLVLIGMRLSQLRSSRNFYTALPSLGIKMLVIPLVVGVMLPLINVTGEIQQAIVLQMAMPPAFATLVLAENYELDQNFAVTALATGSIGILFLLPFWLLLFHQF